MTLFLVGLVSLLAQVVLLRELNVAFYGIELVYLVALAAWLAGTAAGAALFPRRRPVPPGATRILLAAGGVVLPLDVAFIRGSRVLLGGVPGAYLPIGSQLLVLAAAVLPLACLFGLAFRWAAQAHVAAGGRLARAYAVECAGAAAAGLAATIAFKLGTQTLALAIAAGIVTPAAAALAWRPASIARRGLALTVVLAGGGLALWGGGVIDRATTGWSHPRLVEMRDTPYGRVSIARSGSQVSVFENDVLSYESESAEHELLPHLTTLQHAAPTRVLLLGGAVEGLEAELARHHPASLDHVEIDAVTVSVARRALGRRAASVQIADPRAFLERGGTYDVIVSALPAPVSGQTSRFYTREFFQLCAARLGAAGVLGVRLQVPENYLTPAALGRAASVARALRSAFPFVEFLPGPATIAVASRSPLPGPDVLIQRMRDRGLQPRLLTPPFINYLFVNDRREELTRAFAAARVPVNRDAQPVSYFHAAIGWLSKFVPSLIGADTILLAPPGSWPLPLGAGAAVAVALLFALSRMRRGTRRFAWALTAGLAGMTLETVILLDYQAKRGALFEEIGLLMMAFMLGSAAGAWGAGFLHVPHGATARWRAGWRSRLPAALSLVALSICSGLSAWLVASRVPLGALACGLLLAAGGASVGGLFACASRLVDEKDETGMGRLYAADVLGGCLGSLAASLVLVPLGGLDLTALLMAAFALLALLAA